jgi:Helix-turn-helix domain
MSTAAPQPSTQQPSPRQRWREHINRKMKMPADVRGLLFLLYERMNSDGECFRSNENLADDLCVSSRQARRYIAEAVSLDVIEIVDTAKGRLFRARFPEGESRSESPSSTSNVVQFPISQECPGRTDMSTKAVEASAEDEASSLQSSASEGTSGLESPTASRPTQESLTHYVPQHLSDNLGGSTASVVLADESRPAARAPDAYCTECGAAIFGRGSHCDEHRRGRSEDLPEELRRMLEDERRELLQAIRNDGRTEHRCKNCDEPIIWTEKFRSSHICEPCLEAERERRSTLDDAPF